KNHQEAGQLSANPGDTSAALEAYRQRLINANLSDMIRHIGHTYEDITRVFKDFFGDCFRVNQHSDNTCFTKITINIGTLTISALRFYHIPHGAQTIKAWPQWRYAFLYLLQEIEAQLTPAKS
ncbi:MAG: hypothetical protein Q8K36_03400, partial [Alphaproteobacteria bacterium]|nr:hypothetical protein [Alphaproteobacteria bacterium]